MSTEHFDLRPYLEHLFAGEILDSNSCYTMMNAIGTGRTDSFQTAVLLGSYRMRMITGDELIGFREAMVELAIPVDFSDFDTIDLCGTGGDGKDTFNISTAASFVVAGAGYKVAKHGNYGVSSSCGSSNVLEHLGYQFSPDESKLRKDLDRGNFCYMHAPFFHPAMKHVGAIRKGLKVRTFFNMLGPLLNPSKPRRQITGVYDRSLMPLYRAVFEHMGTKYAIIHADDGYDEISLTGGFHLWTNSVSKELDPSVWGLPQIESKTIHGGTSVADAAEIFVRVLSGEGTMSQQSVVIANAAVAIQRFDETKNIADCLGEAQESIESGSAIACLQSVCQ